MIEQVNNTPADSPYVVQHVKSPRVRWRGTVWRPEWHVPASGHVDDTAAEGLVHEPGNHARISSTIAIYPAHRARALGRCLTRTSSRSIFRSPHIRESRREERELIPAVTTHRECVNSMRLVDALERAGMTRYVCGDGAVMHAGFGRSGKPVVERHRPAHPSGGELPTRLNPSPWRRSSRRVNRTLGRKWEEPRVNGQKLVAVNAALHTVLSPRAPSVPADQETLLQISVVVCIHVGQ